MTNVVVSAVSLVQGPLVAWSERNQDYFGANLVLLIATFPLFCLVFGMIPKSTGKDEEPVQATEQSPLILPLQRNRDRALSEGMVWPGNTVD